MLKHDLIVKIREKSLEKALSQRDLKNKVKTWIKIEYLTKIIKKLKSTLVIKRKKCEQKYKKGTAMIQIMIRHKLYKRRFASSAQNYLQEDRKKKMRYLSTIVSNLLHRTMQCRAATSLKRFLFLRLIKRQFCEKLATTEYFIIKIQNQIKERNRLYKMLENDLITFANRRIASVMQKIHKSKNVNKKQKLITIQLAEINWHRDPLDQLPPQFTKEKFINSGAQVMYEILQYSKMVHMVMIMRYINQYENFFEQENWDKLME